MAIPRCLAGAFLAGIILMIVTPVPAKAIPAITCHCFTDRSYDAAKPAAADPYWLATAQNTFFALVFGVDKKSVVLMKQQGVPADDLWVAYWVASRSPGDVDRLLAARTGGASWPAVLAPLQLRAETVGKPFAAALADNASAARLAEAVVDGLLTGYQLVDEGQLSVLRKAGTTNQSLILAAVLANRTGRSAGQILRDVRTGAGSWGGMLHAAGIDGKTLPQEVARALRPLGTPASQVRQE